MIIVKWYFCLRPTANGPSNYLSCRTLHYFTSGCNSGGTQAAGLGPILALSKETLFYYRGIGGPCAMVTPIKATRLGVGVPKYIQEINFNIKVFNTQRSVIIRKLIKLSI